MNNNQMPSQSTDKEITELTFEQQMLELMREGLPVRLNPNTNDADWQLEAKNQFTIESQQTPISDDERRRRLATVYRILLD